MDMDMEHKSSPLVCWYIFQILESEEDSMFT